ITVISHIIPLCSLAVLKRSRIESVCVLRRPVVEGVGKVRLRAIKSRQHHIPCCPDMAFANALEENTEIKSFPVCPNAETILITRSSISDDGTVTRVADSVGSKIDNAISVQVLEPHITRAEHKVARLKDALRRNPGSHNIGEPVVVRLGLDGTVFVPFEVVFLEQ